MDTPSALPVAGGIVRRPARAAVPDAHSKKRPENGDMAHAAEAFKAQTNTALQV